MNRPFVQTYSVVVGTTECNAHCPFCVSKMTPGMGVRDSKEISSILSINRDTGLTEDEMFLWKRNVEKGAKLALQLGAYAALVTGKGEPTLCEPMLFDSIKMLSDAGFNVIELQTNGMALYESSLSKMFDLGLTTVILSCVSHDDRFNKKIYGKRYCLPEAIRLAHNARLSVRLSVISVKNGIDSADEFRKMSKFCRDQRVEQLTVRKVTAPDHSENKAVRNWVDNNMPERYHEICDLMKAEGKHLTSLVHGAEVYDYHGQNVCLATCLTDSGDENIRQLICFPNGHVYYDWKYEGAMVF